MVNTQAAHGKHTGSSCYAHHTVYTQAAHGKHTGSSGYAQHITHIQPHSTSIRHKTHNPPVRQQAADSPKHAPPSNPHMIASVAVAPAPLPPPSRTPPPKVLLLLLPLLLTACVYTYVYVCMCVCVYRPFTITSEII